MSTRTITLTNRPPVTIDEDNWPVIAHAYDKEFDNQYEFQANVKSNWNIAVRQHEDGRAIVYATYSYDTNYQNSRSYSAKHGVLLPSATPDEIVAAIREVGERMAQCECADCDNRRWATLIDECIADMPAEAI